MRNKPLEEIEIGDLITATTSIRTMVVTGKGEIFQAINRGQVMEIEKCDGATWTASFIIVDAAGKPWKAYVNFLDDDECYEWHAKRKVKTPPPQLSEGTA